MRSTLALGALLLVLCVPTTSACSLAYYPFSQATRDGDLLFVDGSELRRVRSNVEEVVEEGFFLTYAAQGDNLLVAGQEGLGGDCSGDGWLRYHEAGRLAWEKEGHARVWPDADGAIVERGGTAFRLEEGDLSPLPATWPSDTYILGWTPEAEPVYRSASAIVVGDVEVRRDDVSGFEPAVARNEDATGFTFHASGKTSLFEVQDGEARSITWATSQDAIGLVWAGGWYVLGGGRAFHVAADGEVTDLGLAAVAIGSAGDRALVFHEDGYLAFEGTRVVESHLRAGPVWAPGIVQSDSSSVEAEWSPVGVTPAPPTAPPPAPVGRDGSALGVGVALATLAAASLVRKR